MDSPGPEEEDFPEGLESLIRRKRIEIGLTQLQLAAKVGVRAETVWSWENQGRAPRDEQLTRISTTLNINLAQLEFACAPRREQKRYLSEMGAHRRTAITCPKGHGSFYYGSQNGGSGNARICKMCAKDRARKRRASINVGKTRSSKDLSAQERFDIIRSYPLKRTARELAEHYKITIGIVVYVARGCKDCGFVHRRLSSALKCDEKIYGPLREGA